MSDQQPPASSRDNSLHLLTEVDRLNEEVKAMALELALYLAKIRADHQTMAFRRLEPEFIRLVSSTIQAVQEITKVVQAARNEEIMVFEPPSGEVPVSALESRLKTIREQCAQMISNLQRYTRI